MLARSSLGASRLLHTASTFAPPQPALSFGRPELDEQLPERGLPRGVIELASPHGISGATTVAIAAIVAAQRRDARAWCAWLDPEATLYAPGLVKAGVDLERLLVVRPPRRALGRVAVKVASAAAFEVVVIDASTILGANAIDDEEAIAASRLRKRVPMEVLVRKLVLLAEKTKTSILLTSDLSAPRALPWPVTLRIECNPIEIPKPGPRVRVLSTRAFAGALESTTARNPVSARESYDELPIMIDLREGAA